MLRQKQVLISHTDKHRCSCRRRCAEDGESYKGVQHLLWVGRQLGKSSNEMFFTRKAITFVCWQCLLACTRWKPLLLTDMCYNISLKLVTRWLPALCNLRPGSHPLQPKVKHSIISYLCNHCTYPTDISYRGSHLLRPKVKRSIISILRIRNHCTYPHIL